MSDPAINTALGRITRADGLTVSFHRSARLAAGLAHDAGAPYKGAAPVALRPSGWTGPDAAPAVIVAAGPSEALWLGFEAPDGQEIALIVRFDGRNALTGVVDDGDALQESPPNFLTLPDQPFLDRVVGADGRRAQWGPGEHCAAQSDGHAPTGRIEVIVYALTPTARQAPAPPIPEDADLGGPSASQADRVVAAHPWASKAAPSAVASATRLGRVHAFVVSPQDFTALTGVPLDPSDFEGEEAAPVQAYRPF